MHKTQVFVSGIVCGIIMCALLIHFNDDSRDCEISVTDTHGTQHVYIGVLK